MACSSDDDSLVETFTLNNDSSHGLEITYKVSAGELDASDSSNYDSDSVFFEDTVFSKTAAPNETVTLYRVTLLQLANGSATGPATPEEFFEYLIVDAKQDGQTVATTENVQFQFINHGAATPPQPDTDTDTDTDITYEYNATITDSVFAVE